MKLDLKRELDSCRARRGEFRIIDVPPLQYLMVDGHGDPDSSAKLRTILRQPVEQAR